MIKTTTKNGVLLFISLCDDVEPNKGGYYCEVFLDEGGVEEFDNFVIHKEDLDCFENKENGINVLCDEYTRGVDDMPILNKKFNAIYDLIGDVDSQVSDFYGKHILYNKNVDLHSNLFGQTSRLLMMVSEIKCLAHDIAERYTWDS